MSTSTSTSTELDDSPSALTVRRDLRTMWRILIAIVIVIGPLGVAVGRGLLPYWTNQDTLTMVSNMLAESGRMEILNWFGLITLPAVVVGTLALGYVARRGSPLLAMLGAGLSFFAWSTSLTTGSAETLTSALGQAGYNAAEIARIADAMQVPALSSVAGIIWLVGHIGGMIVLAIALGRAGVVRWWVAVALAASQPIHFISAVVIPSRLLDVTLGWGLTAFCCLMVGIAVVRTRNDEFDLAPLPKR